MFRYLVRVAGLCGVTAAAACARGAVQGSGAPAASQAGEGRGPRYEIAYRVAMPDPASHLYEIQMDVGGLGREEVVKLQMPVWSPGRYAKMDFARNVQDFTATDASGRALRWDKENGSLWRVYPGGARTFRLRYRVFANTLSGTFSVLDTAHANWNGASLFLYPEGHKPDPVQLTIVPPPGWHVINGSSTAVDQTEYRFPDYDHLIDTPTEVAPHFDVDSFRVDGRLYRVMVHHNGGEAAEKGQRERFVYDVQRLVRYHNTVVAPPPLESYTFLFNIGYAGGDGMEHLYSTQIISARPWGEHEPLLSGVSTAAHEYFHTWNVKRIRPVALGPFDYTREQYQPSLWVAEGWTNYYGGMALYRAGIIDRATLYANLAGMIRANLESPGRKEVSPRMASFHAPFWDGSAVPMQTNGGRTFLTYYTQGEARALLLDVLIRARSNGTKSLDDVLRLLKQRTWDAPSASYYLQGRGYTEADVERAVSDVIGSDMHDWFERYVGGTEDGPYAETLALIGITLSTTGDGAARSYRLDDALNPTDAQRRARDGWLSGK